jgi:tetratricopeptide (TPR) repeat protein
MTTQSAIWYPSLGDYVEWSQDESFLSNFRNSPDKQAIAIRSAIRDQTDALSDMARNTIASNEQITLSIQNGFETLYSMNKTGFQNVSSAIESLHSDMNYHLGVLTQQIEIQNDSLNDIISILSSPFKTKVRELYEQGCSLIQQGLLSKAEQYLLDSISQKGGDVFFPSYYRLGRLYLYGNGHDVNLTNPSKATDYLLKAHEYAEGIYRVNNDFEHVLVDCKYFLSVSYYCQLKSRKSKRNEELLDNAITYCEEAVELNPSLSQGYYHLAKYASYEDRVEDMLSYLKEAFKIDRKYYLRVYSDGIFKKHINFIDKYIQQEILDQKKIAESQLGLMKSYLLKIAHRNVSDSSIIYVKIPEPNVSGSPFFYSTEYLGLKNLVESAERDFKTQTYFGFLDCILKLDGLFNKLGDLLKRTGIAVEAQKEEEREKEANRIIDIRYYVLGNSIAGLAIGGGVGICVGGFQWWDSWRLDMPNTHVGTFFYLIPQTGLEYGLVVGLLGFAYGFFTRKRN